MEAQLVLLRGLLGDAVDPTDLVLLMDRLSDEESLRAISAATALSRYGEQIRVVGAGLVAARSSRIAGHAGLAQSRGHRDAVALVQDLTGVSKAEAARQVRVGESLRDVAQAFPEAEDAVAVESAAPDEDKGTAPEAPWHSALGSALLHGRISTAQHDAIRRGLGDPVEGANEAWERAAEQLIDEAGSRTVEVLTASARDPRPSRCGRR